LRRRGLACSGGGRRSEQRERERERAAVLSGIDCDLQQLPREGKGKLSTQSGLRGGRMRKRDLGILLLAAFAVFFSLHHDGDFFFRESWYHLADQDFPIKYEVDRLPPPLVADLNGDGRPEVLLPTHEAKIQVLQPPHARHLDDETSFHEARVMAEISLLPDNVRVASGRRPIAMAVGTLDRSYRDADVRKQVLVVVTSGWSVMCFDHNLKKLWEANLQVTNPDMTHPPAAAYMYFCLRVTTSTTYIG
jgi:hypothetical protein